MTCEGVRASFAIDSTTASRMTGVARCDRIYWLTTHLHEAAAAEVTAVSARNHQEALPQTPLGAPDFSRLAMRTSDREQHVRPPIHAQYAHLAAFRKRLMATLRVLAATRDQSVTRSATA